MQNKKSKLVLAATLGACTAVIFVTAVTVVADLWLPLKDWLKAVFSHHWIGKSLLSSLLFLLVSFGLFVSPLKSDERKIRSCLSMLFWFSTVGALIIFVFYLYEAFVK